MSGNKVYLLGPSGSGKTVIARRLGDRAGWSMIDTDETIRRRTGRSIADIFSEEGEGAFRALELSLLKEIADEKRPTIVATGGGLPTVEGAMDIMLSSGLTIFLEASADELWQRVVGDLEERPLLHGKDGYNRLITMLDMRTPVYRRAAVTVRTEELTVNQVLKLVLSQISAVDGLTRPNLGRQRLARNR